MTAAAMISGVLHRAPEKRTSKTSGKDFTTATIREGAGDAATWWNVIAFGEAADDLLQLRDGDAVCVCGAFTVETYEKDGETRIGRRIVADRVEALRLRRKAGAP
jgi:single-stranded DNA-binding protein